ncbi:MAG TPA: ABC transporter permease [Terracidiphilus sp.]|jgi:predicted permease|nr:ABC transporter permease [Terracidiphilus sp.]
MNRLWLDIRYALRQLRQSPGFTLTAVLTLAFGIGATTAIFSIVEGVLLRPLPFPAPDRLVVIGDAPEGVKAGSGTPNVTAPATRIYARDTRVFTGLGAYQRTGFELSGTGDPAQVSASRITPGVFQVLGISPLMGRVFTEQEDDARQQVAVISYQMWHSRFHGEPNILGTKMELDRRSYEIIGVMPRDFEFPLVSGQLNRTELWVPMSFTQGELVNGVGSWNYKMLGRLKSGVTPVQALDDLQPAAQEIMRNFPPGMGTLRIHAVVRPLAEATVAQARPLVRTLFLAVAVVLFIGCANLAGLLLVRVIRRRRELSVRLALGASGAVILRQSLIEALALSVGGGLAGLAIASVALRVGVSLLPETLPRVSAIGLDWKVAGFALMLAVLTGLLCGIIPAIAASHTGVNDALKEGGRTGSAGGGHARLRSILVIAELAVALVLLTASGLLLRSFQKMRSVDLGFRTDHALTASYGLPRRQYSSQAAVDAFNTTMLSKLQQLPGVQAVGVTTLLPNGGDNSDNAFVAEGYVPPKGAGLSLAWASQIMGIYFEAAGIPLLRGRSFNEADRADSPLVAIVNRTLAERYWPGQDPIGKRMKVGVKESQTPWMTVVGEIADIKQTSADAETLNQMYTPASQLKLSIAQFAPPDMLNGNYGTIVMRGELPPEQMADSLRAVVRSIDPQLPLIHVESLEHVVEEGQASRRFSTALISSFAVAAVLLALLGIYSVIAFSAAQRTHELAIRLALGSQRASVMQLVLVSGAKLGLAGCAIGAIGAVFATRLLRSQLFQVDPLDPFVLSLAAIAIFLLAPAASIVPARRAASIEPMQALRSE